MFKYDDIRAIGSDYGIIAEKYIAEILMPHLYKFYEEVQARNSDKKVYLVEDNAGSHKKAARLMKVVRKARGILKVEWPLNSSFLHSIEDLWRPAKHQLQPTWKKIRGSSMVSKQKAHDAIKATWTFEHMLWVAENALEKWPDKLQKCIDLNEGNSFKEWLTLISIHLH